MHRTPYVVIVALAFAASAAGMGGMWAFNPDDAGIVESDLLWQAFGIAAYAGFALAVLLVAGGVVAVAVSALRRALSS